MAFVKANNGLYVFVDGAWIQTCGCEDNTISKRSIKEETSDQLNNDYDNEIAKQNGGTIVSRIWNRVTSWVETSSSEPST